MLPKVYGMVWRWLNAYLVLCQGLRWPAPTASGWRVRRHEPRARPHSGDRDPGPVMQAQPCDLQLCFACERVDMPQVVHDESARVTRCQ